MTRIVLAALLFATTLAHAQYPNKPVKLIVGFPPGGSADPTTRIIGSAL
jgi:tripartite-type tricarboxylate transporter receptor subunit TctC